MPKINVYVPAWLAEAVKESAISVSAVCQSALEEAVRLSAQADPGSPEQLRSPREIERLLTNRARTVLRGATTPSPDPGASAGLRLLRALEDEGGNLALVVLDSLGVNRSRLRAAGDVPAAQHEPGAAHDSGKVHDLAWLLRHAAGAAAALGDRHVGCEHLLLALVDDPDEPAARFLAGAGASAESVRQATRTAAAAAAFARSKPAPTAVVETLSAALEDIRGRLGRLEHR